MQDKDKVACGSRFTGSDGWSRSHFSGNFWMARCSHITILNIPFHQSLLDEFDNGMTSKEQAGHYPPYGRLVAEYWMMNDAGESPSSHEQKFGTPGLLQIEKICTDTTVFVDGDVSKIILNLD